MEKPTIKERKQALYDATTKARSHFLAVDKRVRTRETRKHPELEWWQISDLVKNDKEVVDAYGRLMGLCQACNLMGIESGE